MNKFVFSIVLLIVFSGLFAQKPKLVVGIVVDQMSNSYIDRFYDQYGEGGFKRLIEKGHYFQNANYNYIPTYTGPGHASIHTGTTPSLHGIAGNQWYIYEEGKSEYCVFDAQANSVGSDLEDGKRSPKNLIGATISDMLRLHTSNDSKVIGVALKDRSAILPVGHTANAAYWMGSKKGLWITSDYYMNDLPKWVLEFHKDHPIENYHHKWTPIISSERVNLYEEHNKYEEPLSKDGKTEFPYDFQFLASEKGGSVVKYSPFGDEYTIDFAKALIEGEKLGNGKSTDFLAISFSSTDYVGHYFGPFSAEVEDTYVRLDVQIASFLKFLDEKVGINEYVVFLTSDHGVMPNRNYLKDLGFPAEGIDLNRMKEDLNTYLLERFNAENLCLEIMNEQVYLNLKVMAEKNIRREDVARRTSEWLMSKSYIQKALSFHDLEQKEYFKFPANYMQNGYHKDRSGDVLFTWKPYAEDNGYELGAGHAKPYHFDTSVPLIFYGEGRIKPGVNYSKIDITQIAPTICDMLGIPNPPSCTSTSLIDEIR